MPIVLTQPVEEAINDAGPRLKKFTLTECRAIAESGVIDVGPLELIEGDILVKHTPVGPQRRLWTVDEIEALREAGALDVERLELVDGELYDKMGKNQPHVIGQHMIARVLFEAFGIDHVAIEGPIAVAERDRASSDPVPDILVTRLKLESYLNVPRPEDVCLIVEVSDTTLRYDLRTKAALYARAGIIEYWVADLNKRALVVHRKPEEGGYASVVSYSAEESVSPLAAPGATVLVRSLFL